MVRFDPNSGEIFLKNCYNFKGGVKKTANGFHPRPPSSHVHHHLSGALGQGSPFGGHRSNSFDLGPRGAGHHQHGAIAGSKHRNRLSALGRLFKPWKWKRRKKSDKFEKTSKCKIQIVFKKSEFLDWNITGFF